jgi:hypothetical protein
MKGQNLPAVYQWKPSDVYEYVSKAHSKRLGSVIDLTMSKKYYHPDEFERLNVRYTKIGCKGHGEAPTPAEVNRFVWAWRVEKATLEAEWQAVRSPAVRGGPGPPRSLAPRLTPSHWGLYVIVCSLHVKPLAGCVGEFG